MTNRNDGLFAWNELMSTDPKAAAAFYTGLLGWKVEEVDMGPMGTYRVMSLGADRVAGIMAAPPGPPSAWLVYVAADDADGAARKAEELGGKILVPPTTVPNTVRFAIVSDPQGAVFGILKGLGPDADKPLYDGPPRIGTFTWSELHTKDQAAAGKYYGSLFGWTGKVGEGDPMKYWHWLRAGKDIGGMMTLQMPDVPPHWLGYVSVSDVDASTKKTTDLGGKVLMKAIEIEKVGKFSVVQDPTGAAFALFRSAST